MNDSRVIDCYIIARDGDDQPLFHLADDGTVTARLVGYAIIPKEQYHRLTELAEAEASRIAASAIRKARKSIRR